MSTEPRIRAASIDDVTRSLLPIERASQPSPWTRHLFDAEFRNEVSRVDVLEVDGSVAGFVVWWLVFDEVHILNVAVAPEQRRRGYGALLVDHVVSRARAQRASFVTLEVRASNEAAQALYAGRGFRELGRRGGYYRDNGEDALVLGLLLEPAGSE